MDLYSFFIGGFAVLLSGLVQVLTGFGFALIAIPLLMLVFPGYEAVLIGMMLSVFTLSLQARKDWKFARWDIVWTLTGIGIIGIVIGVLLGNNLNPIYLKGVVGIAVLVYVVLEWIQKFKKNKNQKQGALKVKKYPKGFYVAGAFSGLLTGVVGMPGPPVVAVLINYLKKDTFRATLVNYFLINMSLTLIVAFLFLQNGNIFSVFIKVFALITPTIIGYIIGFPLRKLVNEWNFKYLVLILLIFIGISSIWQMIFVV